MQRDVDQTDAARRVIEDVEMKPILVRRRRRICGPRRSEHVGQRAASDDERHRSIEPVDGAAAESTVSTRSPASCSRRALRRLARARANTPTSRGAVEEIGRGFGAGVQIARPGSPGWARARSSRGDRPPTAARNRRQMIEDRLGGRLAIHGSIRARPRWLHRSPTHALARARGASALPRRSCSRRVPARQIRRRSNRPRSGRR